VPDRRDQFTSGNRANGARIEIVPLSFGSRIGAAAS